MAKRRKWDAFDELFSRIFLFVTGISAIGLSIFGFIEIEPSNTALLLIPITFSLLGALLIFVSVLSNKKRVVKWAESFGHNELMIIYHNNASNNLLNWFN